MNSVAASNDTIYAGTAGSGIFRSTDAGDTWVADGLQDAQISAVLIHHSTTISGSTMGLQRTTTGGVSWSLQLSKLIYALYARKDIIYAGDADPFHSDTLHWGNVYISTDDGITWKPSTLWKCLIYGFAANDSLIFAATDTGIYASRDDGKTWFNRSKNIPDSLVRAIAVIGKTVVAGGIHGLMRSTDEGLSWTSVYLQLSNNIINALATNDGVMFAGTNVGIYRSVDAGETWVLKSSPDMPNIITTISSNNGKVYAGTDGGVFISTDNGDSWYQSNTGLSGITINALTADSGNVFAGSWSGVFRSTNNGDYWLASSSGLTDKKINTLLTSDDGLFAGTQSGHVFFSTDHGISWSERDSGAGSLPVNELLDVKGVIYSATNNGVFISSNAGKGWVNFSPGLDTTVRSIANDGEWFYAGTPTGVYRSRNNSTWIKPEGSDLSDVYSLVTIDSAIFAGTPSGIYRSTDNASSWKLSGLTKRTALLLFSYLGVCYAATDSGIFRSTDLGATWTSQNIGLPDPPSAASFAAHNSTLFAGTFGKGVYQTDLVPAAVHLPASTGKLFTCKVYPNPARTDIFIQCEDILENTIIELLDLQGNIARSIQLNPSQTEVLSSINVSDLSSGTYILLLRDKTGVQLLPVKVIH